MQLVQHFLNEGAGVWRRNRSSCERKVFGFYMISKRCQKHLSAAEYLEYYPFRQLSYTFEIAESTNNTNQAYLFYEKSTKGFYFFLASKQPYNCTKKRRNNNFDSRDTSLLLARRPSSMMLSLVREYQNCIRGFRVINC